MNINGGPEELATFIRALNDEPIYLVEEKPREVPVPLVRPPHGKKPATSQQGLSPIVLGFALFCAVVLALIAAHNGV